VAGTRRHVLLEAPCDPCRICQPVARALARLGSPH
jgi:hypothetical protein